MRAIQVAFFKFASFIIGVAFIAQFMAGSEITWTYNKDRANKARQTFWSKTLKVAKGIGQFQRAILRGE